MTGKGNYRDTQEKISHYFGVHVDLTTTPDLVATEHAMKSALSFWASHGIGSAVDRAQKGGKSVAEINRMATLSVNGSGVDRLKERLAETKRILAMSFFKLCEDVEKGAKRTATRIAMFVQLAWNTPMTSHGPADRPQGGNV